MDVIFRAFEGQVFPDDDAWDFVKERGATAHRTKRKRGIKRAALVNRSLLAPRIFQAIHFAVVDHTAALDALIVTAANDLAVTNQHRPNRNAAGGQTFFCLCNRSFEK